MTEQHRQVGAWALVILTVAAIALITFGHFEVIVHAITATGIATTDELVWLAQQGQ
jgi:hypothetical protein